MQQEILAELIERAAREVGNKSKLAEKLGVPHTHISGWKSGARECPPETVAILADFAGLPADQWLVRATL